MTEFYKLITLILLFVFSLTNAQNCYLPNGQKSSCVRFYRCDHFANMLKKYNGKPPQNIIDEFDAHKCPEQSGFYCCPDNAKTSTAFDYSSIQSHRNFKLLNAKGCGLSTADKITRGFAADLREIPWQALLGYKIRNDDTISWGCGGSLITPRFVLTAAHCINRDMKLVRLGEHTISTDKDCKQPDDCNDPIQEFTIEKTFRNPNYNQFKKINDIALIKLSRSADVTKNNVRTICLPVDPKDDIEISRTKSKMTISGFGRLGNGVKEPSNILQKAFVPFVEIDECRLRYQTRRIAVNLEKQFCAGGNNVTDSCNGDSGGPITNVGTKGRLMVYGIVVGGVDCENLDRDPIPSIYTDIRYYFQWILDTIS